jgi:carboxyl-terminal processing protease
MQQRFIILTLFLCVLIVGMARSVPSFAATTPPPCRSLVEFDGLVARVTEQFYDRSFNGLNWPERVAEHRRGIACSDDSAAVASKLNALLAELGASHTTVYNQADLGYWGLNALFDGALDSYAIAFPGVWPERIGERWYARFVLDASPAAAAGVAAGDELVAINAEPFTPLGFRPGAAALTVSTDGATRRTLHLEVPQQSVIGALVNAALASATITEQDGLKVGSFSLWAAHEAILDGLNAALDRFEAARVDALIIDLRGPYGGTSDAYLQRLRERAYWTDVPRFFLIDDSARSGKEWVAALVRRDGLGTLVGTPTAGAFLSGRRSLLFDARYLLYVAVAPAPDLGVGPIEGVGVTPHVYVEPCRTACGGRDPLRQRVFELLQN